MMTNGNQNTDEARWTNFKLNIFGIQDNLTKNYIMLQLDNSMSESDKWGVNNNSSKMILTLRRPGTFTGKISFDFGFIEISQFINKYNSAISNGINKIYDQGFIFQIVKALPKKKIEINFKFTKTTDGARCRVEIIDPTNSSAIKLFAYLTPAQIDNMYNLFVEMKKNYLSISSNYINICNENRIENNFKKLAQDFTSKFEEISVKSTSIITDSIGQITSNLQKSLTELILNQIEDLKMMISSKSFSDGTFFRPENSYLNSDDTNAVIDDQIEFECSEEVSEDEFNSDMIEEQISDNIVETKPIETTEEVSQTNENNDISDEEIDISVEQNNNVDNNSIQETFENTVEEKIPIIEIKGINEIIEKNKKIKSPIKPFDPEEVFYRDIPDLDKHIDKNKRITGNLFIDNYLENDLSRISELRTAYDFMEPNTKDDLFKPFTEVMKTSKVPYEQIEYVENDPNFNFSQYISMVIYKRFVYQYFEQNGKDKYHPRYSHYPKLDIVVTKEKYPELYNMIVGMLYTTSAYLHSWEYIKAIIKNKKQFKKERELNEYINGNPFLCHFYLNIQYLKTFYVPFIQMLIKPYHIKDNPEKYEILQSDVLKLHKNCLESGALKELVVQYKKLTNGKINFEYDIESFTKTVDMVFQVYCTIYDKVYDLVPDNINIVFEYFDIPKDKYVKYNTTNEIRYSIMDIQEVADEIEDKNLPEDIKLQRKGEKNGKTNQENVIELKMPKPTNFKPDRSKGDLIYGKSKVEALKLFFEIAEELLTDFDDIKVFRRMKEEVKNYNQIVSFLEEHFGLHELMWRLKRAMDNIMMDYKKRKLNKKDVMLTLEEEAKTSFNHIRLATITHDEGFRRFDQEQRDKLGEYLDRFVLKEKFFTADDD